MQDPVTSHRCKLGCLSGRLSSYKVEVIAWAPSTVTIGIVFPVEAIIRNRGDSSIDKAVAAIHLPKDVEIVGSKTEIKLGTIRAHRFAIATWWGRALKKGNYAILLSALGRYSGATLTVYKRSHLTASPPIFRIMKDAFACLTKGSLRFTRRRMSLLSSVAVSTLPAKNSSRKARSSVN